MPIGYNLADGILRFTTVGDVAYTDGQRTLRDGLAAATAIRGRWSLLFDVRESTENRTTDEIQGIAAAIGAARGKLTGRCAVLVASPVYYGLGRMFGSFLEPYGLTTAVFADSGEAGVWLRG